MAGRRSLVGRRAIALGRMAGGGVGAWPLLRGRGGIGGGLVGAGGGIAGRRALGRRRRDRQSAAMLVEEEQDVGAVLRVGEAGEGHLGVRGKTARRVQPFRKRVPVPAPTMILERVRISEIGAV